MAIVDLLSRVEEDLDTALALDLATAPEAQAIVEEGQATVPAAQAAQATVPAAQDTVEVAEKAVIAASLDLQTFRGALTAHGWTSSVHLEPYAIPILPAVVLFSATILADIVAVAVAVAAIHLAVDIHPVEAAIKRNTAVCAYK